MSDQKKLIISSVFRKRESGMFASVEDDLFDDLDMSEDMDISDLSDDIDTKDNLAPGNRQLVWNAAVKSSVRVKELGRSCEEYMRLPASECKILKLSSYLFISSFFMLFPLIAKHLSQSRFTDLSTYYLISY